MSEDLKVPKKSEPLDKDVKNHRGDGTIVAQSQAMQTWKQNIETTPNIFQKSNTFFIPQINGKEKGGKKKIWKTNYQD